MADKLKGDDLQEYGFKRIVEELAGIRSAIERNTDTLIQISKSNRAAAESCAKTEHNTFVANDILIQMANAIDKIQLNTFTTETNVIRIIQKLTEQKDERMGDV